MEKLTKTGDLSDAETEKLLGAMSALEDNVKASARKSLDEGVKKGGAGLSILQEAGEKEETRRERRQRSSMVYGQKHYEIGAFSS